ncbi:MAG: hypothetical protein ACTS44_00485 [Candidatus Hodgkinia cicadicola]
MKFISLNKGESAIRWTLRWNIAGAMRLWDCAHGVERLNVVSQSWMGRKPRDMIRCNAEAACWV